MEKKNLIRFAFLLFFGFSSLGSLWSARLNVPLWLCPILVILGVIIRQGTRIYASYRAKKKGFKVFKDDWGALPQMFITGEHWFLGLYVLFEELTFRGTLARELSKYFTNVWVVLFLTSVSFVLWHIVNGVVLDVNENAKNVRPYIMDLLLHMLGGSVFHMVFLVTGNLWVSWMTHFFSNTYGILNYQRWRELYITLIDSPKTPPLEIFQIDPSTPCSIKIGWSYFDTKVVVNGASVYSSPHLGEGDRETYLFGEVREFILYEMAKMGKKIPVYIVTSGEVRVDEEK